MSIEIEKAPVKTTVSMRYCNSYSNIATVLDRLLVDLGGLERYISPGDRVLIKPNLIAPMALEVPAQTHPSLIMAVVHKVRELGAVPFVGDSPAWGTLEDCLKKLGIFDELKQAGVEVVPFKQNCRFQFTDGAVNLSTDALEANAIINLPKMKAHQQLSATIAIKNMYGCVTGKEKAYWHFRRGRSYFRFCRMLIEIYEKLAPVLTIVDAVEAMQGKGPLRGTGYPAARLVGGRDPIACELVLSGQLGIDPELLPIHQAWRKTGRPYYKMSDINVLSDVKGQDYESEFEMPEQIPLHFSFTHIVRSVARQAWIRVKGRRVKGL